MATPRELGATQYIEQHKIMELLDSITSMLLFHRPERPVEFLIGHLEKLKAARAASSGYPCLIDDSNLNSVFGILDPTKQGYITVNQYKKALSTLGILKYNELPQGADVNRVSQETFLKEAMEGLKRTSAFE
ncbi:EF-hand calcium-binding domain-containing protein 10 [Polypterus senegalus]|uniref:EF-hand calcium-binding domain-containing protein 10 n=1 Tax=Polypterus senegalus TaxID=55291 RepID=UPI0019628BCC|nr:EF-hand calcium-binding domain-containing protein 10 [Polypterus senegalus]